MLGGLRSMSGRTVVLVALAGAYYIALNAVLINELVERVQLGQRLPAAQRPAAMPDAQASAACGDLAGVDRDMLQIRIEDRPGVRHVERGASRMARRARRNARRDALRAPRRRGAGARRRSAVTARARFPALALCCCLVAAACAQLPDTDARDARGATRARYGSTDPADRSRKSAASRYSPDIKGKSESLDVLEKHVAVEEAIVGSPLVVGNKVTLLQDGPATYQAMFAAIRGAQRPRQPGNLYLRGRRDGPAVRGRCCSRSGARASRST